MQTWVFCNSVRSCFPMEVQLELPARLQDASSRASCTPLFDQWVNGNASDQSCSTANLLDES